MKTTTETDRPWFGRSPFLLLLTLAVVYLLSAFSGTGGKVASFVINALATLAVLLGLRAVTGYRLAVRLGAGLGLILLIFSVSHNSLAPTETRIWDTIAVLVFFLIPTVALTLSLARAREVTSREIFTACSLYLLIGICFGLAFVVILHFDPGAFTLTARDLENPGSALIHFSFTSLTTVGYGAISPVSALARALADIEATLAQLYLAIVIARLVSLELTGAGFARRRD